MTPQDLIREQARVRLGAVKARAEAEDYQQSYYGRIEGFDGAVGMYWVRVRGGSAQHGRALSNSVFEVGEVVNCSVQGGTVWVDKIASG